MPSQYHFPLDLRSLIPARPRESTAETQPQLHLALLRLSAIISQYFMRTNVRQFIENVIETHQHTGDFKEL